MNITKEDLEIELLERITKDVDKQYPIAMIGMDDKEWWARCYNNRIKETARSMLSNIALELTVEEIVTLIIHAESMQELKE